METLAQTILTLALLKYALKVAMAAKRWQRLLYVVLAVLWALACTPIVLQQPTTIAQQLLCNRTAVSNSAALACLECMVGIALLWRLFGAQIKAKRPSRWISAMIALPNPLFMLAIPYFELMLFGQRAGSSFISTTLIFSTITIIGLLALNVLLRRLNPAMLSELGLMLNIATLIIALLMSSAAARYNVSMAQVGNTWPALLTLMTLAAALFAVGLLWPKISFKFTKPQ